MPRFTLFDAFGAGGVMPANATILAGMEIDFVAEDPISDRRSYVIFDLPEADDVFDQVQFTVRFRASGDRIVEAAHFYDASDDLVAAFPHRRVLALPEQDQADLESFLLQLDGQPTGVGELLVFADGFESGNTSAWSP